MSGIAGRAEGCIQDPHTLPCCLKHSRAGRLLPSSENCYIPVHKERHNFKMATKPNRSTSDTNRDGKDTQNQSELFGSSSGLKGWVEDFAHDKKKTTESD